MVDLLIDVVEELVGHDLEEVEVVVGRVLGTVLKLIIDFTVFHEHVENGVLTMVNRAECVDDYFLLAFITKGNRINLMIHLQFLFLIFWELHILLSKLMVGPRATPLPEVQLSSDF